MPYQKIRNMKKYTYTYEAIEQENESTYYAQTNENETLYVCFDEDGIHIQDEDGNKVEGTADDKIFDAYLYDKWQEQESEKAEPDYGGHHYYWYE